MGRRPPPQARAIPERFRAQLSHYKRSGFDRGHLAPAADHRGSLERLRSTFGLDNAAPQDSVLNRGAWLRLEQVARDATAKCDEVFVATGPLFLPERDGDELRMRHRVLGEPPHVTWIPTHFWKVVLAERADAIAVGCFVLPNGPVPSDADLGDYLVPLENLEAAAGVVLFSDLLTDSKRRALAAAEARHCPRGADANARDARNDVRHLCDLLGPGVLRAGASRRALPPGN